MSGHTARVFRGLVIVLCVCAVFVLAYRYIAGFDWLDAVWIVVVSISSVGYGERSQESSLVKILNILTITIGLSTVFYLSGSIVHALLEGEIRGTIWRARMKREIKTLRNHVILCGYGRVGELLAFDLAKQNRDFVVIERDPTRCQQISEHSFRFLQGDATQDETLSEAGIEHASALVTALPDDAQNVFITLSSRNLNRNLTILARAENAATEKKLRQAGANRVIMPATIGAQQLARMITHPSTADLMQLFAERNLGGVELDEVLVPKPSCMKGKSLRDAAIHHEFGILVLAIKSPQGDLKLNPPTDYQLVEGETLIVMGNAGRIDELRSKFAIPT
jgi:voltage-gated potassium channel